MGICQVERSTDSPGPLGREREPGYSQSPLGRVEVMHRCRAVLPHGMPPPPTRIAAHIAQV